MQTGSQEAIDAVDGVRVRIGADLKKFIVI
jgi:hypothetical protein